MDLHQKPADLDVPLFKRGCILFETTNAIIRWNTVIRPNKKISVCGVSGLKISGRVGTHVLFCF